MTVLPQAETNYARSYGQHDFVAAGGEVVSVVSAPTWEDFYGRLQSSRRLGDFVLSPELITFPAELEAIPAAQADIERRVDDVRQLSLERPDTTIVLGTPTFNDPTGRPANSLLFIAAGDIAAQTNKSFSVHPVEKEVFTFQQAVAPATSLQRFTGMICSDMLGEGRRVVRRVAGDQPPRQKVTPGTETVLLSACWAVPLVQDIFPESQIFINDHEKRFRLPLEARIAMLFARNPNLRDVIVADRLPAGSEVEGPYNGHFTRAPEAAEPGSTLDAAAVA